MTRQELMTNITHRYDWLFDKALSLSLSLSLLRLLAFSSVKHHDSMNVLCCRL